MPVARKDTHPYTHTHTHTHTYTHTHTHTHTRTHTHTHTHSEKYDAEGKEKYRFGKADLNVQDNFLEMRHKDQQLPAMKFLEPSPKEAFDAGIKQTQC